MWRRLLDQRTIIRDHIELRTLLAALESAADYEAIWAVLERVSALLHFEALELSIGSQRHPVWHRRAILLNGNGGTTGTHAEYPAFRSVAWCTRIPIANGHELGAVSLWRDVEERRPIHVQRFVAQLANDLGSAVSRIAEQQQPPRTIQSRSAHA